MTTPSPNPSLSTLTVCCGLTLREPIERWIGPLRRGWAGTPLKIRLMTVPMLEHEPPRRDDEPESGSALLAVIPESEPFSQTLRIVEHARNSRRPALLLCERVDERQRAIADEGILVEPWDTDPDDLIAILRTLNRRQPTVTRLSRELDVAGRLLSEMPVPGSPAEELHLAGLIPDEMIPKHPPRILGLDVGIAHRSAGVIPRDLIDVSLIDEDTVRVFAADGLSEGTSGALLAMRLVKAIRSLGAQNQMHKVFHPGAALAELNQEVCEIGLHGVPHRATALYAVIEIRKGEITLASAGYPLPTIAGPDRVRRVGEAGSALGSREGTEFPETTVHLGEHDLLAISSDGTELAFRESQGFDLGNEIFQIAGRECPLSEESLRIEGIFDSLPGSLHRTNDCTLLTARLTDTLKFGRGAA